MPVFTVTVAGPERHDGEAPYTYVLHAADEPTARALVLAYHAASHELRMTEVRIDTDHGTVWQRKAGGHGPTLTDEVCFLLHVAPEDQAPDGPHSPPHWWGKFAAAVYRWEVLTRKAAPVPVMRGPRGGIKLSPRFCEWLMGLPQGWVTEVPDVPVNEQLARIGNGVVPAQAYAAFKLLLESDERRQGWPIAEQLAADRAKHALAPVGLAA